MTSSVLIHGSEGPACVMCVHVNVHMHKGTDDECMCVYAELS